jgi:hypothetical protein
MTSTLVNMQEAVNVTKCQSDCRVNTIVFIALTCVGVFILMMALPAKQQIILRLFLHEHIAHICLFRVVPFKDRELAITLAWVFARIFGMIPGPILMGMAIDSTCTLWKQDPCGVRLVCMRYSISHFAYACMLFGNNVAYYLFTFLLINSIANTCCKCTGISIVRIHLQTNCRKR